MKYQDILNAFREGLSPIYAKLEEIRCSLIPGAGNDEEHFFLCDANGVRVRVVYDAGNPIPTSITYLDGTPYILGLNTLVECGSEADPVCFDVCVNGVNYRQCVLHVNGLPTGNPADIYYLDVNGVLVPSPAGAIVPGTCGTGSEILRACRCDDVNGDGSLIINYIEFYTVDTAGVPTVLSTYTENPWTPYVPINPVDCANLGATVTLVQQREHLTGVFVWSRPANMIKSLTIKVRATSVIPANYPTVTDHAGRTTPLFLGDVETWSTEGSSPDSVGWLTGNFTITSNDPDTIITVLYLEYV